MVRDFQDCPKHWRCGVHHWNMVCAWHHVDDLQECK